MKPRSLRDIAAVEAEIIRIRAQGYARDDEKFTSHSGEAIGAISVSELAARLPQAGVPPLGHQMIRAAEEISHLLGRIAVAPPAGPETGPR